MTLLDDEGLTVEDVGIEENTQLIIEGRTEWEPSLVEMLF